MADKLSEKEKDSKQINNLLQTCLAILILDEEDSKEAAEKREKLIASLRFNCNNLNNLYKNTNSDLPKKAEIVKIIKDYAKTLNSDLADKNYDDIANIMQVWELSEPDDSQEYQKDIDSSIEIDPTYYDSQRSSLDFGVKIDPNMDPVRFNAKMDAYDRRRAKKQNQSDEEEDLEDDEIYQDEIIELSSEKISALPILEQINYLIKITPEIPSLITGFMQLVELKIPDKRNCDNNFSKYDNTTKSIIKGYIEKFDEYLPLFDFIVLIKVYIENFVSQGIDPDYCNKKEQLYKIISQIIKEYWSKKNRMNVNFDDINHEDFSELVSQLGGKKKKRKSKKNKSHKKKHTKKIRKRVKKSKSHKKKKIYKSNKKSKKNMKK